MLAPPATTAWANALGLQLNVLNDHLKSIAPEIHQNSSQILNRAVQTVSGAAAIDSAISALAPFINLHAQLVNARKHALNPAVRTHDHMADTTNVDRFISPSQLPNETPAPNENRKRPATRTYAEIAASGVPQHARPIIRPRPDRANRQAAALFHVPDPG